jgi:hypothetical protein
VHKTWVTRTLVVLGATFAVLAAIAGYLRFQLFDASTFHSTAETLVADPVVRDQVADSLVEELFANVDITSVVAKRLPANQKGLAQPIATALQSAAGPAARQILARPRAQEAWASALSQTRSALERTLDGKVAILQTQNGYIVVNLRPLILQLAQRLSVGERLADAVPKDKAVIRVMKSNQLQTAQDATRIFKGVAAWLWVVPLALWALAIWLARGRRRREVRAVAISMVVAGILILIARTIAGRYIIDSLVQTPAVRPAAQHTWSILTALLVDGGRTLVGLGIVAIAATWLVGPSKHATAIRQMIAPYIVRPGYAFGAGGVVLLLVVWWGPTAQTRRFSWIVLLAVLIAIGIEVLRRTVAREFPPAVERAPAAPPPPSATPP